MVLEVGILVLEVLQAVEHARAALHVADDLAGAVLDQVLQQQQRLVAHAPVLVLHCDRLPSRLSARGQRCIAHAPVLVLPGGALRQAAQSTERWQGNSDSRRWERTTEQLPGRQRHMQPSITPTHPAAAAVGASRWLCGECRHSTIAPTAYLLLQAPRQHAHDLPIVFWVKCRVSNLCRTWRAGAERSLAHVQARQQGSSAALRCTERAGSSSLPTQARLLHLSGPLLAAEPPLAAHHSSPSRGALQAPKNPGARAQRMSDGTSAGRCCLQRGQPPPVSYEGGNTISTSRVASSKGRLAASPHVSALVASSTLISRSVRFSVYFFTCSTTRRDSSHSLARQVGQGRRLPPWPSA